VSVYDGSGGLIFKCACLSVCLCARVHFCVGAATLLTLLILTLLILTLLILTLLILTLRCCVGTAALLSRRSEETQRARCPSSQQHHWLWQWRWKRARGRSISFILLILCLARRPGFRLSCQDLKRGERGRWWFGGGGNGFSTDAVDGLEEAYASVSGRKSEVRPILASMHFE
jgi:hypothetical protein